MDDGIVIRSFGTCKEFIHVTQQHGSILMIIQILRMILILGFLYSGIGNQTSVNFELNKVDWP